MNYSIQKLTIIFTSFILLLIGGACDEDDEGASDTVNYDGQSYAIDFTILEDWGIENIEGGLIIKDFDVYITDLPVIEIEDTWNIDPNKIDSERVYFVAYFDFRSIVEGNITELEEGTYKITGDPQLDDGKFVIDSDFATGNLFFDDDTQEFDWRTEIDTEIVSGEVKVEKRGDNDYFITANGTSEDNKSFSVSYDGGFDFTFVIDFEATPGSRKKGKVFDHLLLK